MQKKGFFYFKTYERRVQMNEESTNRMRQYFEKLIEELEDGEIREIPIIECVDAEDGDDDAV